MEGRTLDSVGKDYGITRERIRQIVSGALLKLRKLAKKKNYKKEDWL